MNGGVFVCMDDVLAHKNARSFIIRFGYVGSSCYLGRLGANGTGQSETSDKRLLLLDYCKKDVNVNVGWPRWRREWAIAVN